jgi:hypothetical protein
MKPISLIVYILLWANTSFGQWPIYAKMGGNVATTDQLVAAPEIRFGWYFGASTKISIGNTFFLQPELLYSSKGHKYELHYLNVHYAETIRLNYLAIPLMAGVNIHKKIRILAGAEGSYLLRARYVFGKDRFDNTDRFPRRFDFGLVAGIDYEITHSLRVETRYVHGFHTYYRTDAFGERIGTELAANRVLQFGLSYRIPKFKNG